MPLCFAEIAFCEWNVWFGGKPHGIQPDPKIKRTSSNCTLSCPCRHSFRGKVDDLQGFIFMCLRRLFQLCYSEGKQKRRRLVTSPQLAVSSRPRFALESAWNHAQPHRQPGKGNAPAETLPSRPARPWTPPLPLSNLFALSYSFPSLKIETWATPIFQSASASARKREASHDEQFCQPGHAQVRQ